MEQHEDFKLLLPDDTVRMLVQRIRLQRLQKTWTQQELADRAGIPVRTYRQFERTGQLTLTRLVYVLYALGFSNHIADLIPAPKPHTMRDVKRPRKRGKRSDATRPRRS